MPVDSCDFNRLFYCCSCLSYTSFGFTFFLKFEGDKLLGRSSIELKAGTGPILLSKNLFKACLCGDTPLL